MVLSNGIKYINNTKYEGEFLNDKRNGKGKEYLGKYNGYYNNEYILIFEGIYFDNHWKKGKEYYKNNKLKFEGEYLFDEELKGKIYDIEGNIISELNNNRIFCNSYDNGMQIFVRENIKDKLYGNEIKGMEYDSKGRFLFQGK